MGKELETQYYKDHTHVKSITFSE